MNSQTKTKLPVSAIIVNFNNKKIIGDLLSSLYAGSFLPEEIIVVDNCSTDNSQKFIKEKYPQVAIIENQSNLGFAKANNLGIKAAKNQFLWLLNSDTIVGRKTLKELHDYLACHPELAAISPTIIHPDGRKQSVGGFFPSFFNTFLYLIPLHKILPGGLRKKIKTIFFYDDSIPENCQFDYISGAAMFIRKEAMAAAGFINEKYFMYFEDADLCLKLAKNNWRVGTIESDPVIHRRDETTIYNGAAIKKYIISLKSLAIFIKSNGGKSGRLMLWEIFLLSPISLGLKKCKKIFQKSRPPSKAEEKTDGKLKILQINKFFYPRGGAETYFLGVSRLLAGHGHEVVFFSQKNQKNPPCDQEKYFMADLELGRFSWKNIFRIGRIFWSFKAARQIKKLIAAEKPDLIHLHNIYHQISPSILPAIKKTGRPVVMTVHDFKLIKPDYTLRADNSKMGEKSLFAKILMNLEFRFHQWQGVYRKNIDLFIVPSEFVRGQLIKNGFDPKKITVLPHFTDLGNMGKAGKAASPRILYFGRLDESKGVDTLIRAFSFLPLPRGGQGGVADPSADEAGVIGQSPLRPSGAPPLKKEGVKLVIVGDGPQMSELKNLAKELKIENRVEFLGQKNREELGRIIDDSSFCVFPSRVHETFGLGILESSAHSKPVIATKAGAFPELVKQNETGVLFGVDDADGLKNAIKYLLDNPKKVSEMGIAARRLAEKYNPENHYQKLTAIYNSLIIKPHKSDHLHLSSPRRRGSSGRNVGSPPPRG